MDMRVEEWKSYLSHHQTLESTFKGNTLYCLTKGGLFSYNTANQEIHTYSKVEGLDGFNPSTLFYHKDKNRMILGYENGSINYFETEGVFSIVKDIALNTFYTQKKIYQFAGSEERLFAATDFGIVQFDAQSMQPKFTVTQIGQNEVRSKVRSIAEFDGRLYGCVGDSGLYSVALNTPNISDPSVWKKESGANSLPKDAAYTLASTQDILALLVKGKIYTRKKGQLNWSPYFVPFNVFTLKSDTAHLFFSSGIETIVGDKDGTLTDYQYLPSGTILDIDVINDSTYYLTTQYESIRYHTVSAPFQSLVPKGPLSNDATSIVAGNGELYIAPAGYNVEFVPATSGLGIFYYSRSEGDWDNVDDAKFTQPFAHVNYARALYDPTTQKAYFGSWGRGVSVIQNGQIQNYYYCDNSPLNSVYSSCNPDGFDNVRIGGLSLDNQGNLWVLSSVSSGQLKVLKPNGEWLSMSSSFLNSNNIAPDLLVDDYNNKWVIVRRSGIFIYNDAGTLDNPSDDFYLQLKDAEGQGNLPSNVFSFAKDLEGDIWIGTDEGIRIMYSNFLYDLTKGEINDVRAPIVDKYALLRTETVRCITVDGGNRKWIGTDNGVFLVSPSGDAVLKNYTEANSPLPSNNINDIAVDFQTGEVFIATTSGVVSLRTGVVGSSTPCEEVLVYPNPALINNTDNITITGLSFESAVKITTISGMLVKEIKSIGGTAIWDGRDVNGNKVKSGVYLAMSAQRDGNNACIGKFTVINN